MWRTCILPKNFVWWTVVANFDEDWELEAVTNNKPVFSPIQQFLRIRYNICNMKSEILFVWYIRSFLKRKLEELPFPTVALVSLTQSFTECFTFSSKIVISVTRLAEMFYLKAITIRQLFYWHDTSWHSRISSICRRKISCSVTSNGKESHLFKNWQAFSYVLKNGLFFRNR